MMAYLDFGSLNRRAARLQEKQINKMQIDKNDKKHEENSN